MTPAFLIQLKEIMPGMTEEEAGVLDEYYTKNPPKVDPAKKDFIDTKEMSRRPRSELIGLLKDKVWISDDFNAQLEEMKEYME